MYNLAKKTETQVSNDIFPAEAWELISKNRERDDLVIIDVSTPNEYKDLHLEGAINVSLLSRFFKARLEVMEDLRRAETMGEDWTPLVVKAAVYYKGIELCVDALGSVILSDRDDPHLFEVARDVVAEALAGAEKALKELQEEQEEQAPHTVEVTWLTGHEEMDKDTGADEYTFITKGEATAFKRGVAEAMVFADGWLDASAETKIVPTKPPVSGS